MTAALAWLWRITARSNCPLICIKTPSMAANKWFVFRSRSGPHCLISSVLSRIPSAWAHFLSPQQRRKHTSARSQRRHNSAPTPSSGRRNSRCLTAVLHVNKPHRQSKKKKQQHRIDVPGHPGCLREFTSTAKHTSKTGVHTADRRRAPNATPPVE